jgi:hypothetical protein
MRGDKGKPASGGLAESLNRLAEGNVKKAAAGPR